MNKKRCFWCNLKNPAYVAYHDEEWGRLRTDDGYLYEMLLLESFQAGLSWECVLNKRERFRAAFDGFDIHRVSAYGEEKIAELMADPGIIRNRLKMKAAKSFPLQDAGKAHEWVESRKSTGKVILTVQSSS